MTSVGGFIGYMLLQYAVICAVFVALCDLCRRLRHDDLLTFCAAVLALGVIGYLAFWIALANYAAYGVLKIIVLSALLLHFGAIAYRRQLSSYRWLAEPLLYATLFAVAVVTLGFSNGGLENVGITAENRFSHPLPMDNVIPLLVADALKIGRITSPLFGDWLMSDRPPLQTGLYLFLTLRNNRVAYELVAVWLQASFLFGVWGLAVAAKIPDAARRLTLLACCLLPTAIINTFFTWPKMLTVAYLLLVFALMFCRKPDSENERVTFGILIGGLTALSVLSHGSSLFALLGFVVVVILFWAWPPLKTMIYGFVTIVMLYAPWMIYQNFFDPPASRLLKWHFAGVIDIDDRSFLTALRDSYAALSWHDYVQNKIANLGPLIGFWPGSLVGTTTGALGISAWDPPGTRSGDFFQLLPSLHVYSVALLCAVVLLPFLGAVRAPQRAVAWRILVALLATLTVFVLAVFIPGQTINHQGTYAVQVLASFLAFAVLTSYSRWLALAFIAVQFVTVSATYAFTVKHDPAYWPLLAICIAATLTLAAYSLVPRRAGET